MTAGSTDFRHNKFALLHGISHMLRNAPDPVRRAWQEGWTDIEFVPEQCLDMKEEGSSHFKISFELVKPAQWRGNYPTWTAFGSGVAIRNVERKRIRFANGSDPYYEPILGLYIEGRSVPISLLR